MTDLSRAERASAAPRRDAHDRSCPSDLAAEFTALGATRLGISADPVDRRAAFVDKEGLDYPLLSDPDRSIAKAFGVERPGPLLNRRATFVIDTDRTVLEVIASETSMHTHADTALDALRAGAS